MNSKLTFFIVLMSFFTSIMHAQEIANPYGLTTQVKTKYGTLEGTYDTRTKIASFKGVPFAGFGTIVSFSLLVLGFLSLMLGILSEYVGLIYEEVKQRPNYIISNRYPTSHKK